MPKKLSDHHHFFYPRTAWNYGLALKLRRHPYMIVEMQRIPLHEAIHANVPYIPVPNGHVTGKVLEQIEYLRELRVISDGDSPSKRLSVLIGLFSELDNDVAHMLEAQLKVINKFEDLH